jgi:hypothetical protein
VFENVAIVNGMQAQICFASDPSQAMCEKFTGAGAVNDTVAEDPVTGKTLAVGRLGTDGRMLNLVLFSDGNPQTEPAVGDRLSGVPEPATVTLFILGVGGMVMFRRLRQQR